MKKGKARKFITALFVIVALVLFVVGLSVINSRKDNQNTVDFGAGWTFELPEGRYENVDLEEFAFKPLQKGDRFSIENVVPNNDFISPELRIWLCHTAFDVFLENELIYSYSKDKLEDYEMIGNGYHWISLPKDAAGKTIRFDFYVNEPNAMSNVDRIIIDEATDSIANLISDNLISLCCGLFLIMMGVCVMVMSILLNGSSKEFLPLVYIGIFATLIGLWTLSNRNLMQIVSVDRNVTMICEYFSLYAGPLPILLFFYHLRKQEKAKVLVVPLQVMIVINGIMICTTVGLHLSGIAHFPAVIQYFHIFDGIVAAYIIITCIYNFITKKKSDESFLLIGVFILALSFSFDIIIFNLGKYVNGMINHMVGATSLGGMIFVFCMLLSFGNYMLRGIKSDIENEALKKLAYTDSLTGIHNRTRIDELAEQLDKDKNREYTLISFDLNGLKITNDTFGHSAGDELLKSFAEILTETFNKDCVVCRSGGDEYSVVYLGNDRNVVTDLMKAYETAIEKANLKGKNFTVQSAWGIAYSDEISDGSFHDVNKLADKRMYEKKVEMKK